MRRTLTLYGLAVVTALMLLCCTVFASVVASFLGILPWPRPETIAQNFFEAMIDGDVERAVRFTTKNFRDDRYGYEEDCEATTRKYAQKLIAQYAGAEVRNVSYRTEGPSGSWDRPYWVHVKFEFKQPNNPTWHTNSIIVLTLHDHSFRYACGGAPKG